MKKVALIILDGFGITSEEKGNAVLKSGIPNIRELVDNYPKALLKTSSQEVGLPWGEAGNSEVGHTTLGLGRVILQNLPQIDKLFRSGRMEEKNTIKECYIKSKERGRVHIVGIASDGAVHGHIEHIIELAKLFIDKSITPVLHLILDGRDVPEKSAEIYLDRIESELGDKAKVGSVSGRYFAMDRDNNYDRIEKAYRAMHGGSSQNISPKEYLKSQYRNNATDEFIEPASFGDLGVKENEPIIFTNFRADRALQLTRAFVDKKFDEFDRGGIAEFFATMTTYDDNLKTRVLFSNIDLNDPLTNPLSNSMSEILGRDGVRQFHVAETEKFAHVTYFFAGGVKSKFTGQKNVIIPSKKVKSYDQFPQMRAKEISATIEGAVNDKYEFIVANFANGDMVGHSGDFNKTVESMNFLDQTLGRCIDGLVNSDYTVFLTADHGNADEMINLKSGKSSKEHSINPVPFVYISKHSRGKYKNYDELTGSEPIGILSDVAPTILSEMKIDLPSEMTGVDLRESLI